MESYRDAMAQPQNDDQPHLSAYTAASARTKLAVGLVVGIAAGITSAGLGQVTASPLIGWDALVVVFTVWSWTAVWGLDAAEAKTHAVRENPSRALTDAILIGATFVSLIAVGVVVVSANDDKGAAEYVAAGFAVFSVVVTWILVHTLFTLAYARLYYGGDTEGGISFNEDDPPTYPDFAYMAFSLGMTYQVSDTSISDKQIRRTALRQAWISFPLGTVIIATTINLVSGLASK